MCERSCPSSVTFGRGQKIGDALYLGHDARKKAASPQLVFSASRRFCNLGSGRRADAAGAPAAPCHRTPCHGRVRALARLLLWLRTSLCAHYSTATRPRRPPLPPLAAHAADAFRLWRDGSGAGLLAGRHLAHYRDELRAARAFFSRRDALDARADACDDGALSTDG